MENTQSKPVDPLILFVHGTNLLPKFLAKSQPFPWTDSDNPNSLASFLRDELSSENVTVDRFPWTGGNSRSAREKGAKRLAQRLESESSREKILIVAHSHGGNIALRALQQLSDSDRVVGVVCLGTPFLYTVPRDVHQGAWQVERLHVAKNLLAIIFFVISAVAILWAVVNQVDLALGRTPTVDLLGTNWWKAVGVYFTVGLPMLGLGRLLFSRLEAGAAEAALKKRQERYLEEALTLRVPVRCLYAAGDEAFGWLNLLEGFTSVPYFLFHKLAATVLMMIGFFVTLITLLVGYLREGPDELVEGITGLLLGAFLITVFVYAALLLVIVLPIVLLVNMVKRNPLGFGPGGIKRELLVRTGVSPVPVNVKDLEFEAVVPTTDVRHSVYDTEEARDKVKEWVAQLLAR